MSTLHIVNSGLALQSCIATILPGDELLLIEDGVYAANDPDLNALARAMQVAVHILSDDLLARGIPLTKSSCFNHADMSDFVLLCTRTDKSVSWF